MGLVGCIQAAKLPGENAALQAQIEEINKDKWARECAPKETALAISNADFVQLEFQQGDARRATEHMEAARPMRPPRSPRRMSAGRRTGTATRSGTMKTSAQTSPRTRRSPR